MRVETHSKGIFLNSHRPLTKTLRIEDRRGLSFDGRGCQQKAEKQAPTIHDYTALCTETPAITFSISQHRARDARRVFRPRRNTCAHIQGLAAANNAKRISEKLPSGFTNRSI